MIKKCKVISYNPFMHIVVFDFDGSLVQMTYELNEEKDLFVKFERGIYSIVTEEEYKNHLAKLLKKSTKNSGEKSASQASIL